MAVLPVMADLPDRLGLEEKRNAVALGLGLLLGSLLGHGSCSTAHACIRARRGLTVNAVGGAHLKSAELDQFAPFVCQAELVVPLRIGPSAVPGGFDVDDIRPTLASRFRAAFQCGFQL